MIRIAHTSDLHIDERGRLDDVRYVLDAFLREAAEAKADLIVIAGDHFERRSTPVERIALADFLQRAADVAPVFSVRGNHDAPLDLEVFQRLEAARPVVALDRPTAEPGSARIWEIGGGRALGLLALPWFDKAHLVAGLDVTVDQEASRYQTIGAARALLTCLRIEADRVRALGAVPILAGHVMVGGSEVSSGQTLIGTSVELAPADLLEVGAAYAALGHVHMTQVWHGGRVAYSGSPHRCNFGEKEAKGFRLVTLEDDGDFVSNDFVELPARRMVFLETDWTGEGGDKLRTIGIINPVVLGITTKWGGNDVKDALVRFRYHIEPRDLHLVNESMIEAALLADGASEVKCEAIVESATRARAPEIVHVESLAQKLDSYLQAKSIAVDEATHARLVSKLDQLEREALHAA